MLNDVTIVIPTFNRKKFLKKIILYFSKFEITCPIIVADGSDKKNLVFNKKLIREYNLKNNNQIHHVVDGSSFVDRIYNALKLVKTIFCKINTDDDFFSKNYILNSSAGLKNKKNYAAFTGYQISFHSKKKYNFVEAYDSLQQNPCDRIQFSKSNWNIWSTYRTKELKHIFMRATDSMPASRNRDNELNHWIKIRMLGFYMKAYTALLGGVKNTNSCENITIYHPNNWAKKHNQFLLSDILISKNFKFFFKKMIFYIRKDFNLDISKANDIANLILFSDKQFHRKKSLQFRILNKLKHLFFSNKLVSQFFMLIKKDSNEVKKIIDFINSDV